MAYRTSPRKNCVLPDAYQQEELEIGEVRDRWRWTAECFHWDAVEESSLNATELTHIRCVVKPAHTANSELTKHSLMK